MQQAGRLVAEAHQVIAEMIEPGLSTRDLDSAVERLFEENNATPLFKGYPGEVPFPAVTCISIDEQVVHGIPDERRLQEGEIVSVDTGCRINGWCGDAAWTYPVGKIDPLKQRLLEVGEAVLELAIREMGRQKWWSDVAAIMVQHAENAGFSVVEEFVGHGIGCEMHEDPQVPNCVSEELRKHDFRLEPGLVLAIEPMINAGTKEVGLLEDHWTVQTADGRPSVHFEHTVAITADGPLILTEGVGRLVPS
jgi:methionyl aminopeptidase